MKRILILAMLVLLGMTQLAAQDYEYVPFVREGVKWVCYSHKRVINNVTEHYFTLEFKGDTIIGDRSYKAMHKYSGESINWDSDTIPVYLREEGRVVYGIVPEGRTYDDCPIGIDTDAAMAAKIKSGEEFVLYDFNDPVNFINGLIVNPVEYLHHRVKPQTIMVNGKPTRRYVFSNGPEDFCFIEGIGCDGLRHGYPLAYQLYESVQYRLSHVIEGGETIYRSEKFKINENDEYLPVAREGVKWVNERVTVSQGDTTRYYYCYEIKGKSQENERYDCHYVKCSDNDDCQDGVIAEFLDSPMDPVVTTYYNKALEKVMKDGRCMMGFPSGLSYVRQIYSFLNAGASVLSPYNTANFYIQEQLDDMFTLDNLVEVDPINIDGVTCTRYAYINEQGDAECYIVEGIGFDSRDMGDLLTPFTSAPDHDADHQEWCGLSHVVKDGKIIYKGMRYREGTHVGIDEVAADRAVRPIDGNYYNLMGQPVGTEVPSVPGIYIHQGKKILVR